jgi:hypothetical protein
MSGPIHVMPVNDLRAVLLDLIIRGRERNDAEMVHLAVSMTEYLKDAERFQFLMNNSNPQKDLCGLLVEGRAEDFRKRVDELRGA